MKKEIVESISMLFSLKSSCHFQLIDKLGLEELSLKQIKYIKMLNKEEGSTISEIAEKLSLSKPSVTEMIKKFQKMDLVYKEGCVHDKRIQYIKLTDKGLNIANIEKLTVDFLATQLEERLSEEDIGKIVEVFMKL